MIICVSLILLCLGGILCSFAEQIEFFKTMKVHPAPRKRYIRFRYDINSSLSEANRLIGRQKKLRRLPHIFNKVLELPFHSDADVIVEENPDSFRFVVSTDDVGSDVRAHTIEIYPGVTKVVIRGSNVLELNLDELELDLWRFRLPRSIRPEQASAGYVDGELIVTVPKDMSFDETEEGNDREEEIWGEGNGDFRGGVGRLVLVQGTHWLWRTISKVCSSLTSLCKEASPFLFLQDFCSARTTCVHLKFKCCKNLQSSFIQA